MATLYDIFELLYSRGTALPPREICRSLQKSPQEYPVIYQTLLRLSALHLAKRTPSGFQAVLSERSHLLYRLIRFCLANDLRYNELLQKNFAYFLQKAWKKGFFSGKYFSGKDFQLSPQTFMKYVELLQQSGFLLLLSRKPIRAMLFRHSFLQKLLEYFGYHLLTQGKKREGREGFGKFHSMENNLLQELLRELRLFHRLRKKNERKYQALVENYQLRFVQHSLNLEGNPITLPQTVKLLQQKIVPETLGMDAVEEVQNYQRAMSAMLRDAAEKKKLTVPHVLRYHELALQHKPEIAGKIRTVRVFIKNNSTFTLASPEKIMPRLEKLFQDYNAFVQKNKPSLKEIFQFAAHLHNEFQHIHPFLDGNSRTTRLLMFHLLRFFHIPIIDIPLGLLEEYLSSTKGAAQRDDQRLFRILKLIVLYNLKVFNEEMRR